MDSGLLSLLSQATNVRLIKPPFIRKDKVTMRTYESREAAERDPDLELRIIWKCDKCGRKREEYPNCNGGGTCSCGGEFCMAGESYFG